CTGLVGRAPSALKPASPLARARSRIYAMRSLTCSSAPWLRPPRPRLGELIPWRTTNEQRGSSQKGPASRARHGGADSHPHAAGDRGPPRRRGLDAPRLLAGVSPCAAVGAAP